MWLLLRVPPSATFSEITPLNSVSRAILLLSPLFQLVQTFPLARLSPRHSPSPCSNPNLSLPRIQPRSREVRGKLGRMATTTREWKQQWDTIIGRKITNFLCLTYEQNFMQLLDIIGNTYMEGKRAFLVNWLIFLLVLNKKNTLIFACNNRTINFTRNYTKSQN